MTRRSRSAAATVSPDVGASAVLPAPALARAVPPDPSSAFIHSRIDELANRLYPESEIGPVRIEIARLKIQLSELVASAQVSP